MDFARYSDEESKESEHCKLKPTPQSEIIELRIPGSIAPLIEPATPVADRENGDFPPESNQSPLTQVLNHRVLQLNSLSDRNEVLLEDSFDPDCSPRTPKDGVFDPFSPGPAELALAPLSTKYFSGSVGFVARRLQFDSSLQLVDVDEQSVSDNDLLEAVYENLLEVIISNQIEPVDAALDQLSFSNSLTDSCDFTTPPPPHLSGIAHTCPGAPAKSSHSGKLRNFDLSLCRKLEF